MSGIYRTIVVDPPWDLAAVNAGWATTSNARLPYGTMSIDAIKALGVGDLAAPGGCHLYLWTVASMLRHSFGIVEAWGFKPKQVLVWCKPGLGSGMRFRQNVEYVLFASRGGGLPITRRDVGTWHQWPRSGHSVKPDAFYDLVEEVSPAPRVEIFARRARFGWEYAGDQSLSTVAVEGVV